MHYINQGKKIFDITLFIFFLEMFDYHVKTVDSLQIQE